MTPETRPRAQQTGWQPVPVTDLADARTGPTPVSTSTGNVRPRRKVKALVLLLAAGIGFVTCSACAGVDVAVETRIHGISDDRVERLEDAAVVRLSSKGSQQCVDLTVATPMWREVAAESASGNGGGFCSVRSSQDDVFHGLSGRAYVPPSFDGFGDRGERVWSDLIYGIGPTGVESVEVTRGDVVAVVRTDEGAGMTAFVVWWRGSGHPSDPVPMVTVRPAP